MATSRRPSYWEIVSAYMHEGYRAWQTRDDASATVVEDGLGLSALEGRDWHRELASLGLIEMEEAFNAIGAYRLAPRGLEFAERLPDVERLIAQQAAMIDASSGPPAEKEQARFSLKAELLKIGVQKGADVAIANAPTVWHQLQALFPWLK
jgi:hypothetical protein